MTTKQLVLAGGGHSHALVLRLWAMHPTRRPPGLITLVNRHSSALYSGMVPGLVAGLYSPEECAIDLRRLCALTGITFVQAEITAVDLARQELVLEGRPPLAWDLLSLDVGAEVGAAEGGEWGEGSPGPLPVKPLEPFLAWCQGLKAPQPITIHGGGAAAVEVALALRHQGLQPNLQLRGDQLHLGSGAANRLGESLLEAAGVSIERKARQRPKSNPAALACTGSRGPSWLGASGLPTNPAGRVLTQASLQVKGFPAVFASGDCGVIEGCSRAASGVWAVRAAPVLAANLERWLHHSARDGAPAPPRLERWRPQARALQLLGDGGAISGQPRAVAFWGPFAWGPSELLWRWKQAIDQRFMEGFTGLQAMGSLNAIGKGNAMACHGCGAKLAAAPLAAALEQAGLGGPAEDAAVVGLGANGETLLQSVDGFPALVTDTWLNARLTTLHACSDLWASGAQVQSVQALVTVPQGPAPVQQQLLAQTLAGVRSVLEPMGAQLIGGHTLEERGGGNMAQGAKPSPPSLALTVNGSCPASPWPKGPLQGGDALVLVKPIGTGVLFAAAMAAAPSQHCKPAWIDQALAQMQQSQAPLVDLLRAHGCRACTDITGFGLLGHLGEMVQASAASIQVTLDAPALQGLAMAGSLELLEQGYASSLAPSNARALALLEGPIQLQGPSSAALANLLIDPQTCGPLLAALPAHQAPVALAALHQAGFAQAAVVGQVQEVS